jgi:galactonate dehydratase
METMKSGCSRRQWFNWVSAGLGGLLAAERKGHAADANYALIRPKDSLKITRLELIPVHSCRTIFTKMHTDAGIVGLGEGTVEGRISTVMAAIKELEEYLIGKDPRQVAHHWQAIYRQAFYRGGVILTSALSAVDIAMWDIKGKALGVPVYELLGGPTRDGIHIYYAPTSPDDALAHTKSMGIKSFKISPHADRPSRYGENPAYIKQCYDSFAAYRNTLGPDADIGCELHGDHPPQTALELIKAIEPLHPWFYEEPVQFENLHAMAAIAKKTNIPIATGERMVNKWQFRELLALEAASFLQPDITHCGGITELRAIAALAESYYAGMLPHCKEGIVGATASMHVAASIPNLVAHEIPGVFTTDKRVNRTWNGGSYIKKPLVVASDGYIKLKDNFTAPGLGIELDDNLVDNERGVTEWEFPKRWDAFDGSVDDH